MTVTLSDTTVASAGTPPAPTIGIVRDWSVSHGESKGPTWLEGRESRMRVGVSGWNHWPEALGTTSTESGDAGPNPLLFWACTVTV